MFKLRLKKESDEVFYKKNADPSINTDVLKKLRNFAHKSKKQQARICFHNSRSSDVHIMMILHNKCVIVPKHKHLHADELVCVIQGKLKITFYGKKDRPNKTVLMGPSHKNNVFLQIIPKNIYHSMEILSKYVVFLEIIKGPFRKGNTIRQNN